MERTDKYDEYNDLFSIGIYYNDMDMYIQRQNILFNIITANSSSEDRNFIVNKLFKEGKIQPY